MRIKIISAYDNNYKELSDITFKSIESYCIKYGYDYQRYNINEKEFNAAWYKLKYAKIDLLNNCDYLVWIDTDAIIYNQEFDLMSLINDYDITLSKDINAINCGVMIFKKSLYTLDILDDWFAMAKEYNNSQWWEQSAFIKLYNDNYKDLKKHVNFVEQKIINAYDYKLYDKEFPEGQYDKNSFILHFPGINNEIRIKTIKQYESSDNNTYIQ